MLIPKTESSSPNKAIEILIVDNDEITRKIHSYKLGSRFSYPVSAFENGAQALDYILENPNPDYMVLLEIELPIMDAWDFLTEIAKREIPSELYVIIVSCSVSLIDKVKSRSFSQTMDFFEKPLDASHLDIIARFLEMNQRFSGLEI